MKQFFLAFLILTGTGYTSFAQQQAQAATILAGVSKKYKSYDAVKADFTFTLESPQNKAKETQQGSLTVQAKSNRYRVVMTDQDMISDGKTLWTYLKKDKEVQVANVNNEEGDINPAKIFTLYEKGFKYSYTGERKVDGKVQQFIDLTPIDSKKSYAKIRLGIDKVAKQIASVLIFDKNGNKYTYTVKSFAPNVKVPESTYSFDAKKYPGVEVVDLR